MSSYDRVPHVKDLAVVIRDDINSLMDWLKKNYEDSHFPPRGGHVVGMTRRGLVNSYAVKRQGNAQADRTSCPTRSGISSSEA